MQKPGERQLRWNDAQLLRQFFQSIYHVSIRVTDLLAVKLVAVGIGCRPRSFRPLFPRQQSTSERTPWDDPDSLIQTKRNHLPFLFSIEQIVMVLHRDEARPAVGIRAKKHL